MLDSLETTAGIASAIYAGNTRGEAALLEKYYRQVLFILRHRTKDEEAAKDLCQETFRIVLERLRREPLREPAKLAAFLRNTAINLHIAEIRKAERRKTYFDSDLLELCEDESAGQEAVLAREQARTAVRALIAELDNARDRKLLYRYYIEELEKDEICRELALDNRHFDKVISRARKRFRDLLTRDRQSRTDMEVVK